MLAISEVRSRKDRWWLDPGALAPVIDAFAGHLCADGYTVATREIYLQIARHFAAWLHLQPGIELAGVDDQVVKAFLGHSCCCHGKDMEPKAARLGHVRRFVRFLRDTGIVAAPAKSRRAEPTPVIQDFLDYARRHRGVADRTLDDYRHVLNKRLIRALGSDPAKYTAALVRQVIVDETRGRSLSYVKNTAKVLRHFLKFLVARGDCPPYLNEAVPRIVERRLTTLPRYLPGSAVDRLIASCNPATQPGIRDRAVLLLLSRLGLRAGDVWAMRLDDIEWQEGTLRVQGKGRRQVRLPLPQDVGDALLDYLKIRPETATDRVFIGAVAPYRPLATASVVSDIVSRAVERAGITDAPSRGAHMLRHTAATQMLRAGASLDSISSLLRHQSLNATVRYAKVDFAALRQIAQPWPGGASC